MDPVLDYFASDPLGPLLVLPRVVDDSEHPIAYAINEQLALFPTDFIETVKIDRRFLFYWGHVTHVELDRKARMWVLLHLLSSEIPKARLKALRVQSSTQRPSPYNHVALSDLRLSGDFLVPLREFRLDHGALIRNDYAFTVLCPVESPNSQHWLLQALAGERLVESSWVRLDPMIVRPAAEFPRMSYRMWWWGRQVDWNTICKETLETTGRWFPGPWTVPSEFTEYVFSPRDGEMHLRIEEFPKEHQIESRGSRYFHAVYDVTRNLMTHLDGAVRIYQDTESWHLRKCGHLWDAGKIGSRVKVFRIDRAIAPESFGPVCSNYFVWNLDIARFFGADIPEEL
ncbi:MAG: hypothetical protein JSW03_02130 [Candidatus Eiseniibacteriota bacterium]|nr:MAG: hypothetical protein JSW03_02130 [Candidatus Eisenbacteria bacterium]